MSYAIIAISAVTIILIGLAVLILILKRQKLEEKKPVDYRSFFILGICWMPLGIVFWLVLHFVVGIAFFVMGGAFLTIGLVNRDKWTEPQTLSGSQRKLAIILIAGGILLLLLISIISIFLFLE